MKRSSPPPHRHDWVRKDFYLAVCVACGAEVDIVGGVIPPASERTFRVRGDLEPGETP